MTKLHNGQRVTKLWKDERWEHNMKSAGIASSIGEMNFQLKLEEDKVTGTFKRLRTAVKGRLEKKLANFQTLEELRAFTDTITGHRKIIDITELDRSPANKVHAPWIELLFACTRERPSTSEAEKRNPLLISLLDRRGTVDSGLAFLNHKIPGKLHDSRRRMYRTLTSSRVFDLTLLLSELMIENALVEFAKSNMENLRFAYAKDYVNRLAWVEKGKKYFYLPEDETFRNELVSFLKEKHLYPKDVTEVKTQKRFNKEVKLFNLSQQDDFEWIVIDTWFKDVAAFEFLTQMFRVRDKTKKEIEQAKHFETARAFETKKNIPNSHLAKMKNNAFLARYKYVEIDELLEIDEFEKLEEEFLKLQKLTFIPYSDGSFRVRRLGRHKAAGIYFSHVNATIIDDSSSYIHELHHQIDYTSSENGLISESIAFRPILEAYKRAVSETVESLPDSNLFKAQWNGNSKYNKDYYLDPAEVFARSAEIYLSEVKKIETSFLKPTYKDKPEYPLSPDFIAVVEEYFERLYTSFYTEGRKEEKKKIQVAAPTAPKVLPEVTLTVEGEQYAFEL